MAIFIGTFLFTGVGIPPNQAATFRKLQAGWALSWFEVLRENTIVKLNFSVTWEIQVPSATLTNSYQFENWWSAPFRLWCFCDDIFWSAHSCPIKKRYGVAFSTEQLWFLFEVLHCRGQWHRGNLGQQCLNRDRLNSWKFRRFFNTFGRWFHAVMQFCGVT